MCTRFERPMEHRLHLDKLTGTERLVLLLYFFGEDGQTSDARIAVDLNDLTAEHWTRDRVNTIRRALSANSRALLVCWPVQGERRIDRCGVRGRRCDDDDGVPRTRPDPSAADACARNLRISREELRGSAHKTAWGASEHLQLAADDDA